MYLKMSLTCVEVSDELNRVLLHPTRRVRLSRTQASSKHLPLRNVALCEQVYVSHMELHRASFRLLPKCQLNEPDNAKVR